jgi:hypothetical protein
MPDPVKQRGTIAVESCTPHGRSMAASMHAECRQDVGFQGWRGPRYEVKERVFNNRKSGLGIAAGEIE